MHEGHRSRMIEKLKLSEGLPEHELLEMLLFNAIPRKNTNGIAHELINTFNGLTNVFEASIEQLCSVKGVGESTAAYIKVVGLLIKKYAPQARKIEKFDPKDFPKYLWERYSGLNYEVIDMFLLDSSNRIKAIKTFTIVSVDSVVVDPRVITKTLIDSNAFGVVFAHNHPNAPKEPSDMDDRFTKQCQVVCSMNNIRLLDHYICGKDGVYSYLNDGKLYEINKNYSIFKVLEEDED